MYGCKAWTILIEAQEKLEARGYIGFEKNVQHRMDSKTQKKSN